MTQTISIIALSLILCVPIVAEENYKKWDTERDLQALSPSHNFKEYSTGKGLTVFRNSYKAGGMVFKVYVIENAAGVLRQEIFEKQGEAFVNIGYRDIKKDPLYGYNLMYEPHKSAISFSMFSPSKDSEYLKKDGDYYLGQNDKRDIIFAMEFGSDHILYPMTQCLDKEEKKADF